MCYKFINIISKNNLASDRKGSALIEFAIVFPVLFLLIGTIIEFTLIFMTESILEGAMTDLSRFARVELIKADEDKRLDGFEDLLKQHVEDNGFGIVKKENMVFTTDIQLPQEQAYLEYTPEYCIDPEELRERTECVAAKKSCPDGMILEDANVNGKCDTGEKPPLTVGNPGDIVNYRLIYKWGLISPLLSSTIADDRGEYIAESYGVIRNER